MSDKNIPVTVNLVSQAHEALVYLQNHTGLNDTDIINRALQLYKLCQQKMDDDGLNLAFVKLVDIGVADPSTIEVAYLR